MTRLIRCRRANMAATCCNASSAHLVSKAGRCCGNPSEHSSSPIANRSIRNIREDIEKFTHLRDVVGIAKKSEDLPRFLKDRKPIIVTTQQKLAYVLDELQKKPN